MTVNDLIKKLAMLDRNTEVCFYASFKMYDVDTVHRIKTNENGKWIPLVIIEGPGRNDE